MLEAQSSSNSEAELEASFDEEEVLKYYFNRGFDYQEMLRFLSEQHHHALSYSMELRQTAGLICRSQVAGRRSRVPG